MGKYKLKTLKLITKFGILDISKDFWLIKNSKNINMSKIFWNTIISVEFFQKFINEKFIPSKKNCLSKKELEDIYVECNFISEKLELIKDKINFMDNFVAPWWNDIFFSYRLFSNILYYYNDYYSETVEISLRYWLTFLVDNNTIEDYIVNLEKLYNSDFISNFISDLLCSNNINVDDNILYKFDIFWPDELILAWILSKLIKKSNKNAKIVIDFSIWNEQFDFSWWITFIEKNWKDFFQIFDNFIIRNDFWNWVNLLLDYHNWLIEKKSLKNIIYFDGKVVFNDITDDDNNKKIFNQFLISAFDKGKISRILWKKSYFSRFLPYKCYWSNCNFCAINSQNKFEYNNKYSYDFFIDKWIVFIEENDIYSINFKDEAIPPKVILQFAQKIIERWIKLNYQFRARFEKSYTLKNCKILYESWARFCWIWLESAVDRVNEKIWNKWNIWITIEDKVRIIHNFDKAGIAIHNYSIMWFPWETEKESIITYKFLKNNIILSNFYTCTPNIFWLMKWTKIFLERGENWIEIKDQDLSNPFKLSYDFTVNWKKINLILLNKLRKDLHFTQFLPWLKRDWEITDPTDFWYYIDRSYIFYLTKRYNKTNPFYVYKNVNNSILDKEFKLILKEVFSLSEYIQIFEQDDNMYVYDWVMCVEIKTNHIFRKLLLNFNNTSTLNDNLKNNWINNSWIFKEEIISMLKNNLLLHSGK